MAETLKRSLGRTQLVFYGVGTIVGAGIYSIVGAGAGIVGADLWLSFALASVVALITVLSYAELSSAIPKAGAEYQFLKRAFPRRRLPSFIAGLLLALNASATSATVALAFAGYLNVFVAVPPPLTALALLFVCTLINIAGIQQSTWVSILLICIEVGGLLLLIAAGAPDVDWAEAFALPDVDALPAVLSASALVFFVYIGFEDVANLAEESKEPRKDMPWALLLSVSLTSVVYVMVVVVALAAVGPEALAASDSPLEVAAGAIKPWMSGVLATTALFATASTALISLVSISRLLFGMARDGAMPAALAKTLPGRKTPWVAGLALFASASALLPLGDVRTIASVSSLGILVVFIGVQLAVIVLRRTEPDLERPFRVPLTVGRLPLPPVIGIAMALALTTRFDAIVYAVAASVLSVGTLAYLLFQSRRPPHGQHPAD